MVGYLPFVLQRKEWMENHLLASVDDVSAHQCKRCKTSRENLEKNKTRIRGIRQVRSRVSALETPTIEIFVFVIESDNKKKRKINIYYC